MERDISAKGWVGKATEEATRTVRTRVLRVWASANGWLDIEHPSSADIYTAAEKGIEQIRSGSVNLYDAANRMLSEMMKRGKGASNSASYYRGRLAEFMKYVKLDIDDEDWDVAVTKIHRIIRDAGNLDPKGVKSMIVGARSKKGKALVSFVANTGCRPADALRAKISDLDLTKTPARVHFRAEVTKTRRDRWSFLSTECVGLLKDYLGDRTTGYIFEGQKEGTPTDKSSAWEMLHRIIEEAGLLGEKGETGTFDIKPYTFRAFAEGVMTTCGMPEKWIDWLIGHGAGVKEHYRQTGVFDRDIAPAWQTKCNSAFCFMADTDSRVEGVQKRLDDLVKATKEIDEKFGPKLDKMLEETARPKFEPLKIDSTDEAALERAIAEGYEPVPGLAINGHIFLRRKTA
jgi:hypothetical protein